MNVFLRFNRFRIVEKIVFMGAEKTHIVHFSVVSVKRQAAW